MATLKATDNVVHLTVAKPNYIIDQTDSVQTPNMQTPGEFGNVGFTYLFFLVYNMGFYLKVYKNRFPVHNNYYTEEPTTQPHTPVSYSPPPKSIADEENMDIARFVYRGINCHVLSKVLA